MTARLWILLALGCGAAPGDTALDGAAPDTTQSTCAAIAATPHVRLCSVTRAAGNPLISPATHPGISNNISMPSVIRAPDALGFAAYWMYFAAHDGH